VHDARDDAADFTKPGWQVRLGARTIAREIELDLRRREAYTVQRPDHLDLSSAEPRPEPNSGRRQLAPDPALLLLGRYFRRSRLLAGFSQEQLERASGVPQTMLSRLERGLAPRMAVERLATLGTTLARLFPLGVCPHDHDCAWQPVRLQDDGARAARFLDYLRRVASDPEAGTHDATDVEIGVQLSEVGALADGDPTAIGDTE
jgi:transcriptional regulator with XRE-family HTH domain